MEQGTIANTLLDELTGSEDPAESVKLPGTEVIQQVNGLGEASSIRSGLVPVDNDAQQRVRLLARRASLALNEEYQDFLRAFPQVAEISLTAEVFAFLGAASMSLASYVEASGQVQLSMLQGSVSTGAQIVEVHDDVASLVHPATPGGAVTPVPGMERSMVDTLLAKPKELIEGAQEAAARKAKRTSTKNKKLAEQVAAAESRLHEAAAVERLRQAARSGALPARGEGSTPGKGGKP